jgi:hypothetical protein
LITATAATASAPAKAAAAKIGHASVHHFLNEWLESLPLRVIFDFEVFSSAFHHPLLKLSGVKISSAPTPSAPLIIVVVLLCQTIV